MWITFLTCGKERTFVEKMTPFYQNHSLFFEFYPRFYVFERVIHKKASVFELCTSRLWTSYPPFFAPFLGFKPAKPYFEKLPRVIHAILIHFF